MSPSWVLNVTEILESLLTVNHSRCCQSLAVPCLLKITAHFWLFMTWWSYLVLFCSWQLSPGLQERWHLWHCDASQFTNLAWAKSADNKWLPAKIATRKGGCQPMLSLSSKMPLEAQKKCNFVKYLEICTYVRRIRIFLETALGSQFWSDASQFIIFCSPGHLSHLLLHLISGCK